MFIKMPPVNCAGRLLGNTSPRVVLYAPEDGLAILRQYHESGKLSVFNCIENVAEFVPASDRADRDSWITARVARGVFRRGEYPQVAKFYVAAAGNSVSDELALVNNEFDEMAPAMGKPDRHETSLG